jgi:hypothetical protein
MRFNPKLGRYTRIGALFNPISGCYTRIGALFNPISGCYTRFGALFNPILGCYTRLGALYAESGLLLIHPLLRSTEHDKAKIFGSLAAHVDRDTHRKLCSKGHKRVSEFFRLPSALRGVSVWSAMVTDNQMKWKTKVCYQNNECDVIIFIAYFP